MVSDFSLLRAACRRLVFVAALCGVWGSAQASIGLSEIAATADDGPVTLYYPSSSEARPIQRGRFTLTLAAQGTPVAGNGRLVVISHGSGGAPWVHADLARTIADRTRQQRAGAADLVAAIAELSDATAAGGEDSRALEARAGAIAVVASRLSALSGRFRT